MICDNISIVVEVSKIKFNTYSRQQTNTMTIWSCMVSVILHRRASFNILPMALLGLVNQLATSIISQDDLPDPTSPKFPGRD